MEEEFDVGKNFWDIHEQLKHVDPFKTFREAEDNDEDSTSLFMWFIKYMYHPESNFRNVAKKARAKQISKSLLGGESFYEDNKDGIDEIAIEYCKLVETTIDRAARAVAEKIDQKIEFLETIEYDVTNATEIDQMTGPGMEKQSKALKTLLDLQRAERQVDEAKGGEQLSASDKGEV